MNSRVSKTVNDDEKILRTDSDNITRSTAMNIEKLLKINQSKGA